MSEKRSERVYEDATCCPWLDDICCCVMYCCGFRCCCCTESVEGSPLIPKDVETQEMEFHVIAQSSAGSTPWASERQSEISEPPNAADLELPTTEQPHSQSVERESDYGSVPGSDRDSKKSWKLIPSKGTSSAGSASPFTVQMKADDS